MISESDALYAEALKVLSEKDLAKAKDLLKMAIDKNPQHTYAHLQLAFIDLWQGHLEAAQQQFDLVLSMCKCNEYAVEGLGELAIAYERKEDQQRVALALYRKLNNCVPDSYKYRFGLARTLSRTGEREEASKILDELMSEAPEDSDVALQRAQIHLWEKEYDRAKAIYTQHADRKETTEGLAKISMAEGDFQGAIQYYEKVLQDEPSNIYAMQNLARIYAVELRFNDSKKTYQNLVKHHPLQNSAWQELLDVKLHTDPTINYYLSYFEAKENDPNIKKPVVRDYYFDSGAIVFIPVKETWRVDLKTFFAFQEEKNILPTNPGINFNVDISGAELLSHLWFADYFKWDVFGRVKRAWNVGHTVYPFQRTTRFEPGTLLSYNDDTHLFSFGANADSYVIKNFAKIRSQLLTLKSIDLLYRYTAPIRLRPEVEVALEETFVESIPRNRRDTEAASLRFLLPYLEEYFKAFYTFEHRHFQKLNINYYSFFEQWRNTFGFSFFVKSLKRSSHFDLTYWHRTQGTKDLYQPIGDFVYIAPWQFLKCNQVQATYHFWLKDFFKANISGGYYRDTLPYRAWNVQGQLFFVF